ncbi:hypothetical protein BJY01DRAFT_206996 [Aspergillus pseudoustus]|uniref:Transmembrane protein n=1 Tax=Aspergillus pseudoustus TaxID=1810923 RepID=A0ABR4KMA7_9EURO
MIDQRPSLRKGLFRLEQGKKRERQRRDECDSSRCAGRGDFLLVHSSQAQSLIVNCGMVGCCRSTMLLGVLFSLPLPPATLPLIYLSTTSPSRPDLNFPFRLSLARLTWIRLVGCFTIAFCSSVAVTGVLLKRSIDSQQSTDRIFILLSLGPSPRLNLGVNSQLSSCTTPTGPLAEESAEECSPCKPV